MIKKISFIHWACAVSCFFFLIVSCDLGKKQGGTDIAVLPGCKILYHDKVSEDVLELLKLFKLTHDGTLSSIVGVTQAAWLRRSGIERWELAEVDTSNCERIRALLTKLGLFQECFPQKKTYDYIVILGASFPGVKERYRYLLDLWSKGIRADKIVMLAGDRPLDQAYEINDFFARLNDGVLPLKKGFSQENSLPKNETEMMKLMYDWLELPKDLAANPPNFIDAPKIKKADGSLSRPTTESTIYTWLEQSPKPGSCLFLSHQPYVAYQEAVIKTVLPNTFTYEVVGSCVEQPEKLMIANLLDTVARILYQELAFIKKQYSH